MWDGGRKIAEYSYNPYGLMTGLKVGESLFMSYAYDADRNLVGQRTVMGEEVLQDWHFTYDGNGNMRKKQGLHGTQTYEYDCLNRLTKAEYPSYQEQLFYDAAGNRVKRITAQAEQYYTYDWNNRLIQMREKKEDALRQPDHADVIDTVISAAEQVQTFAYDRQGNLVQDAHARYEYDAFGRMRRAQTTDGAVQQNRYDAEGLRHEMEENGQLVQFLYSGREIIVSQKDGADTIRYIRGYGLLTSDSEKARTYYHYVSDEKGSITHLVSDQTQEILNEYTYDAFGNRDTVKESVDNLFGYTGQQYDAVTFQAQTLNVSFFGRFFCHSYSISFHGMTAAAECG